jgi:hypothetical protein
MKLISKLGNQLTHFGWALWGQGCDCGHNPFNRLADCIDPWINDERYICEEMLTSMSRTRNIVSSIGGVFVNLGTKLS